MTTMARVDETLARFDRKSPRDAYKQTCEELQVHFQREIYNMLPEAPMAYHRITVLELDKCLLGTKGCMAVLPIILVSTTLRKVSLRTCGVSDEFVKELCEILQGHPSVRAVDISNNELVTVYSAPRIISLMKNNSNMVSFDVAGTHLGTNVGDIIAGLGYKNMLSVSSYYQDNYFNMKDRFNYLDENGNGWVGLKNLVLNCPFPVLQEQFVERIALKRPRKRSDNTISLNTFLQLVYMNYKSETEIAQHSANAIDAPYVFVMANWKQVISAVERFNAGQAAARESGSVPVEDLMPTVVLPEDSFHRLRIRDFLLTNDDAYALVDGAVRMQLDANAEAEDNNSSGGNAADTLELSALSLVRASKSAFLPPPSDRPVYAFFEDRDAGYIPEIMRSGSRIFSMGNLDLLNASAGAAHSIGGGSSRGSVVADPSDPERVFSLPSSVVKTVTDFFNREVAKAPKKRDPAVPDSPRTRKDKAMEKASIPIRTFLSAEFVTDLEKIRPCLLADYYARYSLVIDDCSITLQEMINILDELYVQVRVDTIIPLSVIRDEMVSPLTEARYGEFLSQHLLDRDEETGIVVSLAGAMTY